MEGLNGNVVVDVGSIQREVQEKPLKGGKKIHLVSYDSHSVATQRASGIVIGAPTTAGEYDVKVKVKEGDHVFFEPAALLVSYNRGGKIGETTYAFPYHFLICKIDDGNIEMLNGKVLVEEKPYEEKIGGIIVPDIAKKRQHNIFKVLSVGDDNFKGKKRGKKFYDFGDDGLKKGDYILGSQFAGFDLQSSLQEGDYKQKKINREYIVAIVGDEIRAHGLYVQVKPLVKEAKKGKIIIPDNRKMRPIYGEVLSMGSGIRGLKKGDIIRFKDKKQPEYKGYVFVHIDSILVTCKGEFQPWESYRNLYSEL
jgi:co-chaperonin GroES (HSP10)